VRLVCRYHSHPHITVLPSHVDVKTQAAYQMLDEGFVGIIISAFSGVRPLSLVANRAHASAVHGTSPYKV
jgi:proteasome lid subunit RPN8/RPN11